MNKEIKLKKCSKCGEEFPATNEYFHKHNGCKDGLNSVCKICRSENAKKKNRKQDNLPEDYKQCVDCGEILKINTINFNKYNKSSDGYYNVCIKCQIKRRRNGAKEGYKKCKTCGNIYPLTRDYFQPDKKCLDDYRNMCWECIGRNFFPDIAPDQWSKDDLNIIKDNYTYKTIKEIIPLLSIERTEKSILHIAQKLNLRKINSFVENYNNCKYKIINNILHKYCKSCNRYLSSNFVYFPKDESCTDKLRNVCRECKGENFKINSNVHIWTDEEKLLLKENYPHMTNNELKNKYFPFVSTISIMHKAKDLCVYKTEDTINKIHKEIGIFNSNRLLAMNKWVMNDNPQYNSQRFGELNPNYKGGISALYQELRRNIKQWKLDSMENCNYKCFLSNNRFDHIHHLYSFESIVKDTLEETGLPLYENISWYTQDELQKLIDKCLEIHYRYPLGICLEEKYHLKFHAEFGYGNNNPEQFYEFIENYYNDEYKDLLNIG